VKRCFQLIAEMKQDGDEFFTDPEFGPNDDDPTATSSLYYDR